jgi:hypothetical protein
MVTLHHCCCGKPLITIVFFALLVLNGAPCDKAMPLVWLTVVASILMPCEGIADVSVTTTGKLDPVAVLLLTASIVNTIFCSGAAFSHEKIPNNNIVYNKFFIM